jgi:hypothetical protein
MEKQNLNKYIVIGFAVFAVLVLVLGDVFLIGMNKPSANAATAEGYITGYIEANYTLESFKDIVKVFNPANFSDISQNVSSIMGVKKVYENPDQILIMTENETAPMEIYDMVNGKYGTVMRKAVLTPEGTGMINRTIEVNVSMPLEVYLNPTIGTNSTVVVSGEAAAQGGEVKYMQNSAISSSRESITISAKIVNVTETNYLYSVDFENRTMIGNGDYIKEISNIVMLPNSSKEKKDYVSWLGDRYIIVNESMANKTKIIEDYGNVTFQDSVIRSREKLNISYATSEDIASKVTAVSQDDQYILPNRGIMELEIKDMNSSIKGLTLVLDAEISGNLVLDYTVSSQYPAYS